MSETNNRIDELIGTLVERHNRIKQERRAIQSTIIGLSSGAILLNITFMEKIAPEILGVWVMIISWLFLGLALFSGIFCLIFMTAKSHELQVLLEGELVRLRGTSVLDYHIDRAIEIMKSRSSRERELQALLRHMIPNKMQSSYLGHSSENVTFFLFTIGILFFGGFAAINLLQS